MYPQTPIFQSDNVGSDGCHHVDKCQKLLEAREPKRFDRARGNTWRDWQRGESALKKEASVGCSCSGCLKAFFHYIGSRGGSRGSNCIVGKRKKWDAAKHCCRRGDNFEDLASISLARKRQRMYGNTLEWQKQERCIPVSSLVIAIPQSWSPSTVVGVDSRRI